MHLPTNTLLHGGKYKIIEKIGQGGFGIAYKANHELLNRVVCIKEFYYSDLCERKTNSSDITIVSTSSEKYS
jgi:serine/threonine protein kinase